MRSSKKLIVLYSHGVRLVLTVCMIDSGAISTVVDHHSNIAKTGDQVTMVRV